MIMGNAETYRQAVTEAGEDDNRRLQQQKMEREESHNKFLQDMQERKLKLDESADKRAETTSQFTNQKNYADTLETYHKLGIDPMTGKIADNNVDVNKMADNIFNASGLGGDNFEQSAKNMNNLRNVATKQYGEDSRSFIKRLQVGGTSLLENTYGKDKIDVSTFSNPEKLNNFFNTEGADKVRKSMGLNKSEWEDYKQDALKYSQGASGIVNTMVDSMVKTGFLPSAQQIDLKTMNSLSEIATSANPKERFADYLRSLKTNKTNLEELEGKGSGNGNFGGFTATPIQNFYNAPQSYEAAQQTQGQQQMQQGQEPQQGQQGVQGQPQQQLPPMQQLQQPTNTPQETTQQVDSVIQQLPKEQQAKVVDAKDNLNDSYDEILKRLDPVDRKQAETFIKSLKGEGTMGTADSLFAGIGNGLRSLFNIGFKLAGSSLPPSEIMEKAKADNPTSSFIGELVGMDMGMAPIGAFSLGASNIPRGVTRLMGGLATGAIMTGAIHADDINEKAYEDDKLGMVYDLVAPNNILEGVLAYGIPLLGGAMDYADAKGFKRGVNKVEEVLNVEESGKVGKSVDKEVEGVKTSEVKKATQDTAETADLTKKAIKAETSEKLTGARAEDIYKNTKQTYAEKIKPMETFGEANKFELSNVPIQKEKTNLVNKLDNLGVDPTVGGKFGKDIGRLRGEVQNAKTYDDYLKIYREINSNYSSDAESFYTKVGDPLKTELRDILDEATNGKFREANRAYEDALLIDKSLGISSRFKKQPSGTKLPRSEMIDQTISQKLGKAIDNPVNTRIRSLLAGGEEQLADYSIGKLGELFRTKNSISTIEDGLRSFSNNFSDVLQDSRVAGAFDVASKAAKNLRGVENGINQLLTDLSKKTGVANMDIEGLASKFNEFSEKYLNVPEADIGLARRFGDELLSSLDTAMDGIGQKYFNENWDKVRSDVMAKMMNGEPVGKDIEAGLKRMMEGNLIKGIIDEATKKNPALQYALDALTSIPTLSIKDFMKNTAKAIYHATTNKGYKEGVTQAVREAMARRGQIYMPPEIEALLNAKKIASTTFLGYKFGVEGNAWRRKSEEALFGLLKNSDKIIQSPEARSAGMKYANE